MKAANCLLDDTEYRNNKKSIISEINFALSSISMKQSSLLCVPNHKPNIETIYDIDSIKSDSQFNQNTNNSTMFQLNDKPKSKSKIQPDIIDSLQKLLKSKNSELRNFRNKCDLNEENCEQTTDNCFPPSSDSSEAYDNQDSYTVLEIYEDKIISKTKFSSSNDKKEESLIFHYQINL